MAERVSLTGDKALDAALAELEPKMQKKILRKATRESAKLAMANIARRAPVKTGRLRDSFKVRSRKRSRKNKHSVGVSIIAPEPGGDIPYYAVMIEYGTKNRFHKSGKFVGKMREDRPFIRPGLYESGPEVKAKYHEEIRRNLNEFAHNLWLSSKIAKSYNKKHGIQDYAAAKGRGD